jgi:hypothetical protein
MKDDVPRNAPHGRIIKMTVYRVMSNYDLTEGRGRQYVAGVYGSHAEATRAAKGAYVMGSDCPVEPIEANVVKVDDDTYYLLGSQIVMKHIDPRELRAAALAKLTDEDKEILGLK